MTIKFDASEYRRSHGKEPRGYGMWWFAVGTRKVSAPSGTLTEAKAWMRLYVASLNIRLPYVIVDILP